MNLFDLENALRALERLLISAVPYEAREDAYRIRRQLSDAFAELLNQQKMQREQLSDQHFALIELRERVEALESRIAPVGFM